MTSCATTRCWRCWPASSRPAAGMRAARRQETLNRLEHPGRADRYHKDQPRRRPPSRGCSSTCSWRPTRRRRNRSCSTSTPPTIPVHGHRRAGSSTATTTATATCRSTCSAAGHLLAAKLRRSNIDASAGAVEEVARIVGQIRARWPRVKIVLRADSGFAREALMAWCEANRVDFLFGLARNARLVAEIESSSPGPRTRPSDRPAGAPLQADFRWSTRDSWSRRAASSPRPNGCPAAARPTRASSSPRSSPTPGRPHALRGPLLRPRRHGEPHQGVPARPLRRPHQRRHHARQPAALWFASMAYVLLCALRRIGLAHTELARPPAAASGEALEDRRARARLGAPRQDRHGLGPARQHRRQHQPNIATVRNAG
jgi:hypothetical protein